MLLANCVRRINSQNLAKCLNESLLASSRRCIAVASTTRTPVNLANYSLPNLTSTTVFTSSNQCHNNLLISKRCYSSDKNDNERDESLVHWSRKLPRFQGSYILIPTIFTVVKNALSTLLICSYFDPTFDKTEFLNGVKQAVVVVSNQLAVGNFEELQDLVDDKTIEKMRQTIGPMTKEQRECLAINESDIQSVFMYEIQFITKECAEENKSRFFVEIMAIVHAIKDNDYDIELNQIFQPPNKELLNALEESYSVANYRFIKEFTKGVEDDWTINYILHAKPSDDIKEKEKEKLDLN